MCMYVCMCMYICMYVIVRIYIVYSMQSPNPLEALVVSTASPTTRPHPPNQMETYITKYHSSPKPASQSNARTTRSATPLLNVRPPNPPGQGRRLPVISSRSTGDKSWSVRSMIMRGRRGRRIMRTRRRKRRCGNRRRRGLNLAMVRIYIHK